MKPRISNPLLTPDDLRTRQSELYRRLVDGDEQISSAKRAGTDTSRWENHWITLLREYESVSRTLDELAPPQYLAAA